MINSYLKQPLPRKMIECVRNLRQKYLESRRKRLPLLTEDALKKILVNDLGVKAGNVVFIHSSINNVSLGFPFFRTLKILQDILGEGGTMLFPTYPQLSSYKYLMSGEVFDVRKTPSFTGALTEFARRQRH